MTEHVAILKPFRIRFNNRKKKKPTASLQEFDCDGGVFVASGHVVIDVDASKLKPLYTSLEEMRETLGWWGDVTIYGLEEEEANNG